MILVGALAGSARSVGVIITVVLTIAGAFSALAGPVTGVARFVKWRRAATTSACASDGAAGV